MSDKIYIFDTIPDGYIYGEINRDYIDLYNKESFRNETATYYRIYYNYSSALVVPGTRSFSNYTTTFSELPVSRDFFDRPDCYKIISITFILCLLGLWLVNLITSSIKRGGLLGGLF